MPVKVIPHAFQPQKLCDPIDSARVAGFDTESLQWDGRLVTDIISTAYEGSTRVHERKRIWDEPLESFLEEIVQRFGVEEHRPSRHDTERRTRDGKKAGARSSAPLGVLVMFNGPYDVGRLFPQRHWLQAIHSGLVDYRMLIGGRFEIEWKSYLDKSAPQFVWFVRDLQERRFARVQGIDMTGYWKCSLERALKAVGLTGKVDLQAEVEDAFERPRESFSPKELQARRDYAETDGLRHLELYWATTRLLERVDPRVITRKGLIPPSAPGAAARIMFARAFDCHPMVKEWLRPPPWAEELAAASYYGGRAFAPRPGRHEGLASRDIKSAYPTAMCLLPDPVTTTCRKVDPSPHFSLAEWRGRWGSLVISGECTDDIYPAFRVHHDNRLRYVYGRFKEMVVTIPEICIGVARGVLKNLSIHGGVWLDGSCESSFLRRYVLEFFRLKEASPKGSPMNELAKLLINSAYGKLIEVQAKDVVALGDSSEVRVPDYSNHVHAKGIIASLVRVAAATLEGAPCAGEHLFFGKRLLRGDRARRYDEKVSGGTNPLEAYVSIATRAFGPRYTDVPIKAIVRHARSYKAGPFFMPSYASQITGFVSAQLGLMGACLEAYCGDTDSVAYPKTPDEPARLGRYHQLMGDAGYLSAREGGESVEGTTLGQWCLEMNCSTESYIVRPKRYSHAYLENGKTSYKQAHHGMSRFTTPEAERASKDATLSKPDRATEAARFRNVGLHEAMRRQLEGETVRYVQRPSPRKGRTAARSGEMVGEFVAQEIEVVNSPVPGTREGYDGWVRWLPLDDKKDRERRRT